MTFHKSLKSSSAIAILILLFCTFFYSCKSKKYLSVKEPPNAVENVSVADISKNIDFDWFEAKAKLKFKSDAESQSSKCFIRIKRDSAILLAVKKLSYEAGRMLITKDSVYYVNRIDHFYQVFPLDTLQSLYGINPDFSYITNAIVGTTPKFDSLESSFKTESINDSLRMSTVINDLYHIMTFNPLGLLSTVEVFDRFSADAFWSYDNYKFVNDTLALPFDRTYNMTLNTSEKFEVELEFLEITLNKPKAIYFKIPANYQKLN